MEKYMERKHLRDTGYFKRCCSSVSHSNLESVNQVPNARVWAYTHKYCKPSSGKPALTRDENSGYSCESLCVPTGLDSRFNSAHPPPPPPDMSHSRMGFSREPRVLTPWKGPGCTASPGREQVCWVRSAKGP